MAAGQLNAAPSVSAPFSLGGVPVLLYHGVVREPEGDNGPGEYKYGVTLPQFREHLGQILQLGRRTVLLRELSQGILAFADGQPPTVLTFDDGKASDYVAAFPALAKQGLCAEFFVNTSTVGTSGHVSWQQIAEMHRAGMSIQSHSHDHVALSPLPRIALERQLKVSKQMLEDRLGTAVDYLAAPYGLWNQRVLEAAQAVGYRAMCISRSWPARPGARLLSRTAVYRHTSPSDMRKLLTGDPAWYGGRALREAFLYLPKQILLHFRPARLGVRVLEVQT